MKVFNQPGNVEGEEIHNVFPGEVISNITSIIDRFDEEFATEYSEGFPGDSMATLKRDFSEGMSELEAGVEDLPFVSE